MRVHISIHLNTLSCARVFLLVLINCVTILSLCIVLFSSCLSLNLHRSEYIMYFYLE